MSQSLLEKLQKKPVPEKKIVLNPKFGIASSTPPESGKEDTSREVPSEKKEQKGRIALKAKITVNTDTNFDIQALRARIKKRGLTAPKLPAQKIEKIIETAVIVDDEGEKSEQPKKLKKKKRLPGQKSSKKRQPRVKREIEEIQLDIPASLIEIGDRPLGDRINEKEPNVNVKPPRYYLNNREIFVNFINNIFQPYVKQIKEQKDDISCATLNNKKGKGFSLMTHQQIVRDYLNIYSPYRGLLLYHGLGAGKTCASIGIAEGMKDDKQVIIMTPASLRMNYISELKHCGDPIYKKNQYWEKISTEGNPHLEKAVSELLHLDVEYIRKLGGAWMVDMKQPSNFETLEPEEQKSIDSQINKMIMKKYRFINYNGMRESHLDSMIEISQEEQNSDNPFDNKVIVIDEAHNFVSRIVNKLKSKKKSLSTKLYELIMMANNTRVVFLTGTPIINYPNEIAILFNMLRGYIKTFYFPLDTSETSEKINQAKIKQIFEKASLLDYVEYRSSNNTLIVTKNPFGFSSRYKRDKTYAGVSNNVKAQRDDNYFRKFIIRKLRENNINVINNGIRVELFKSLPDTLETFTSMFIDQQTGNMKNVNLFKRRILGLTSYFRSATESLLPRYDEEQDTHIIKIPMSHYQLGQYETARAAERKEELRNAKKKKKQQNGGIYENTTSTYRIFSRAFCNFVFPNQVDEETNIMIERPMPKDNDNLSTAIETSKRGSDKKTAIDEDILDGGDIDERLDNIDGRYDADDQVELEKQQEENVDNSYPARIKRAVDLLVKNADKYFTPAGLAEYSPKFLKVLQNLTSADHLGLHLIYSQFRTLEGIGLLSLVLKHNGFARFQITKNSSSVWEIAIPEEDIGKPTFALYTGTETAEEKEIVRNIFNGTWDSLPSTLAESLRKIAPNNNLGEIVKVLMLTSSGSEGITLRNTRYVHIIEPYWHPVRTEQVIGRARRICSHQALEEELRTVEVFLYLMTFTDEQLYGNPEGKTKHEKEPVVSIELKLKDVSKIDKKTPLTSDEALFEIQRIKKNITRGILRSIKESSIDCSIHSNSNSKEGLVCYSFGSPSVNTFSYKPDYTNEEKDTVSTLNKRKITWKAYPITIQGTKYAVRRTIEKPKTKEEKMIGDIYDLDSYKQALKHGSNPILVGRTQFNPKKKGKVQFVSVDER